MYIKVQTKYTYFLNTVIFNCSSINRNQNFYFRNAKLTLEEIRFYQIHERMKFAIYLGLSSLDYYSFLLHPTINKILKVEYRYHELSSMEY